MARGKRSNPFGKGAYAAGEKMEGKKDNERKEPKAEKLMEFKRGAKAMRKGKK